VNFIGCEILIRKAQTFVGDFFKNITDKKFALFSFFN
jgi:hypothetical protein